MSRPCFACSAPLPSHPNSSLHPSLRPSLRPSVRHSVRHFSARLYASIASTPDPSSDPPPSIPASSSVLASAEKVADRRLLLALAAPTYVAQLADPVAAMVDLFFIGRLGTLPLAGASIASSVFNTVLYLFGLLSFTSNTLIAQTLTLPIATRRPALARAVLSAVVLSAAIGIIAGVPLLIFAPYLCTMMGAQSGVVLTNAVSYLRARALGFPALVVFFGLSGVFRGLADLKRPLYATMAGNMVNILLDPLLIFAPLALGCVGAGLATTIAACITTSYLLLYLVRSGTVPFKMLKSALKVPADHIRAMLVPLVALSGKRVLENGILALACACAARIGPAEAAAMEISRQWWWFAGIGWWPISLALAGISARALAEKSDRSRVRNITLYVVAVTAVIGVFAGGLTFGLASSIPRIFISDPTFLAPATASLRIMAPLLTVSSVMDVCDAALIASNDGTANFTTTALAVAVAAFIMLKGGITEIGGIWMALLVSYVIRMVLNFGRFAQLYVFQKNKVEHME